MIHWLEGQFNLEREGYQLRPVVTATAEKSGIRKYWYAGAGRRETWFEWDLRQGIYFEPNQLLPLLESAP